MFFDVVLPVVRDRLVNSGLWRPGQVQLDVDERPSPGDAESNTITLHPGSIGPGQSPRIENGVELTVGFLVGITHRIGKVPRDRYWSRAYANRPGGLCEWIRNVYSVLAREKWELACDINATLTVAGTSWRVVEPFQFDGNTVEVAIMGPAHLHGDPLSERPEYAIFALMTFGSARFMSPTYEPTHVLTIAS